MLRAHFGLTNDPFSAENITLLPHQQQVLDIVRVHCQQGGFCLIMGEPGTGKSVLKRALCEYDPKRMMTPVVNRTLHTSHSTLRILCEAFQIDAEGHDVRCERRLIAEARRLNTAGKMLAPIIDDATSWTPRHYARSACSSKTSPRTIASYSSPSLNC